MPRETETLQNITSACRALAQGDYTHRHNQVASIVPQEWAINFRLSKGPPMPYHKNEPQCLLENADYELYHDRPVITDRTIHSNRPDIVVLDKTIREAYLMGVATPKVRAFTEASPKSFRRMQSWKKIHFLKWQLETACIIPRVLSTTGIIPSKLRRSFKSLDLRRAVHILMQKAVILNTCRIVRKFLAEQYIRSAWSVRPVLFWE
jgi:hypothetical protein